MRRTPPLIVGGGPAGAAAAIMLGRASAQATLFERAAGAQDVVCGAFLGWDAIAALKALGIDIWTLGAKPIRRVRLVTRHRSVERDLPALAAGLSRRTLDAALLAEAETSSTRVRRGVAVRRVEGGVAYLASGEALHSDALFVATGKHALRGAPRIGAVGAHVGLRTALPAARDLVGVIELHLFDRGYAGVLLQEDGRSNLCLSVAASRLAAAETPARLIAELARERPAFAARLGTAAPAWSAIAGVPYGWRDASAEPGRFRLGDQAAVIASLAGDGIAVALASGRAAAAAWIEGGGGAAPLYQRSFAAVARRPIMVAEGLRRLAERPGGAAMLTQAARVPGLVSAAARATRIGHADLQCGGLVTQ